MVHLNTKTMVEFHFSVNADTKTPRMDTHGVSHGFAAGSVGITEEVI
jgi:hypothetical protein